MTVALVVPPEIQTRSLEVNLVVADLIAQQAPRRAVIVARDEQPACKIAQS